jgi:pyroglutamyl-peptidase
VHPAPIRVNYKTVRALVPRLWDGDGSDGSGERPEIDLAIHIGMAGPRMFYSIERRGHRDGYKLEDVDGELLEDWPEEEEEEEDHDGNDDEKDGDGGEQEGGDGKERKPKKKKWIWAGLPKELLSDLDVEDVLRRWRRLSPVCFSFPPFFSFLSFSYNAS